MPFFKKYLGKITILKSKLNSRKFQEIESQCKRTLSGLCATPDALCLLHHILYCSKTPKLNDDESSWVQPKSSFIVCLGEFDAVLPQQPLRPHAMENGQW